MKHFIISLLFTALLYSCDYEAQNSYKIINNSSTPIKVISTNTNGIGSTDTFAIDVNAETTIAVISQGLNGIRSYKETGEYLRDFSKMDIFKNDTTRAATDFLKTERWTYYENSAHTADYKLTVENSDF